MRDTFKYHVLGFLSGALILFVSYWLVSTPSDANAEKLADPLKPVLFRTIGIDDKLDLARLSATKALDGGLELRWAFPTTDVCNALNGKDFSIDVKEIAHASSGSRATGSAVVVKAAINSDAHLSENDICDLQTTIDPTFVALTDSQTTYEMLRAAGVAPTMLAVARDGSFQ